MNKQDFILKYLHGELTDEEHDSFVKLTESDQEFADNVKLESILYAQHKRNIKDELISKANIKSLSVTPEGVSSQKTKVRSLFPLIRNIAAIFILGFISYFLFIDKPVDSLNSTSVIANHLNDFHQPPHSLMSGIEVESDPWKIAIESYKQEKFELAVEQIEKIDKRTNEQNLYLALSRMYSDQQDTNLEISISDFETILKSDNKVHTDEARWFLSLAHLLNKDNAAAKIHLTQIVDTNAWNADKAASLLKELNL